MSKSILMSIKPHWVERIIVGDKTIEVRKKFPKDFRGWIYIYCTKAKPTLEWEDGELYRLVCGKRNYNYCLNSKVVARFWCDKVEEIIYDFAHNGISRDGYKFFDTETLTMSRLEDGCQLDEFELYDYLKPKEIQGVVCGYAIHISKLEIFDRPRELSEFKYYKKPSCESCPFYGDTDCYYHREVECDDIPITKAPQSWQYCEVNENDK